MMLVLFRTQGQDWERFQKTLDKALAEGLGHLKAEAERRSTR